MVPNYSSTKWLSNAVQWHRATKLASVWIREPVAIQPKMPLEWKLLQMTHIQFMEMLLGSDVIYA